MCRNRYPFIPIIPFIILAMVISSCNSTGDGNVKPSTSSTLEMGNGNDDTMSQYGNVESIKVGDTAPDFTLKDLKGNTVRLSSLRGKKILLNISWLGCRHCKDEMPLLQEIYKKWSPKGLIVLSAIVYDSENVIRAYAQNNKLTFTILADPDKKLNRAYTISGFPTTFFIDGDGVVREIKGADPISIREVEEMLKSLGFST